MLNRDFRGRVTGLVYYGLQLVVSAEDDAALDAIAVETRKHRGLRSFIGAKDEIDGLWSRVAAWHAQPSIIRAVQPLYALEPQNASLPDDPVPVRPAREDETELVAEHSARMILNELGYDPRAARASFTAGVRRAVAAGMWWVWIERGELRFQCNIGPRTQATTQLQGVWTPEELRGRGYATRALGALARALLATDPTLSLYVNDFNTPAIALYERLGFRRVGTFATYLF